MQLLLAQTGRNRVRKLWFLLLDALQGVAKSLGQLKRCISGSVSQQAKQFGTDCGTRGEVPFVLRSSLVCYQVPPKGIGDLWIRFQTLVAPPLFRIRIRIDGQRAFLNYALQHFL